MSREVTAAVRNAITNLAGRRGDGEHPGLLLQRYLTKVVTGDKGDPQERKSLLNAAIQAAQNKSLLATYAEAYARWNDSFCQDMGRDQFASSANVNVAKQFRTTSRLIVGLGAENVLETGLRLHHTYGVPIIPGSALKGLAAHYCHEVWGQREPKFQRSTEKSNSVGSRKSYHSLLFGTTEDGGVITFHDAWITPESLAAGALRMDVMTPHHRQWQTGEAPPTDFDSPVPIQFLSVSGTFQVRLSWSGPSETPLDLARNWTKLAMELLQEALAEWGIGGKTSSGYGRLVPVDESTAALPRATASKIELEDLPPAGSRVEAVLLEEKTKRGGWKARHVPTGLSGPVQNSFDVPPDKKAGDPLTLIVTSVNRREISFRYPTAADEKPAIVKRDKPQGGPRGTR